MRLEAWNLESRDTKKSQAGEYSENAKDKLFWSGLMLQSNPTVTTVAETRAEHADFNVT